MRKLVNFPAPCETPSCAAIEDTDTAEVVYGPEGLPGETGPVGAAGVNGLDAFTTTSSAFSMPAVASLASVQVLDNRTFAIGQLVFIAGVGYFSVESKGGTTQMSLRNLGGTSALPPGALVGAGIKVTSGAQPGWDVPGNTPKRFAFIAHMEDMGEDGGPLDVQIGAGPGRSYGGIKHFEVISDPDSIVSISGSQDQQIKLANGLWKMRVRTPAYFCKAFKVYLIERPGPASPLVFNQPGVVLAVGNGYAGFDSDGADPQRHATVEFMVPVTDPAKHLEVYLQVEEWSFSRALPLRNRTKGVGSNFDDGAATPVREIFTLIEIEEQ